MVSVLSAHGTDAGAPSASTIAVSTTNIDIISPSGAHVHRGQAQINDSIYASGHCDPISLLTRQHQPFPRSSVPRVSNAT
eukprot:m.22809 g.22809  ORF g.22809 m.22809 type:complete len:80 (-) comp12807_c1_seq1:255-494(-)